MKLFLVYLIGGAQILGYFLLFFNWQVALGSFTLSFVGLIVIIIILIKERLNEKKEENKNDYRDY